MRSLLRAVAPKTATAPSAPYSVTTRPNSPSTTALVVFVVLAAVIALLGSIGILWLFILTGDITVILLGTYMLPTLLAAGWVVIDAPRQDLPAFPWLIVVLFLSILGLALYLVVRDVRRRRNR
jgi:hypothetical protein